MANKGITKEVNLHSGGRGTTTTVSDYVEERCSNCEGTGKKGQRVTFRSTPTGNVADRLDLDCNTCAGAGVKRTLKTEQVK